MTTTFPLMLSIIIPIFNAAAYLPECLESVLKQGLDPSLYEVLLIDDGSTDNSYNICQNYARKNPNFKLFTKSNEGQSATRNLGISLAQGDYIYMMDADDFLIPNGLRNVIDKYLSPEIDILQFSSTTISEEEASMSLPPPHTLLVNLKSYSTETSSIVPHRGNVIYSYGI